MSRDKHSQQSKAFFEGNSARGQAFIHIRRRLIVYCFKQLRVTGDGGAIASKLVYYRGPVT